jgi:sterol desaturase/sphingolipid hydroxylase (fatty acid hydroxylase superfamily)
MEAVIAYFSTIPALHRGLILAGGIAIFWILESAVPLVRFEYKKWHHAGINIFFTVTTIIVNFAMAFMLLMVAEWATDNNFGLLPWMPHMNNWLFALIGLLLLDFFAAYLAHWSQHKTKWMWRFHLIHHTDTWIDTTSANRHHPGESAIRFIFTTVGVLLIGAPMWLVFLYQSLSVVFSQMNHANISLPSKLDRAISYVLVSPDMHKVHHHYLLPYTDSNYGNIFSLWDRLFGTFSTLERDKIVYGVDTHMEASQHNSLKNLLSIPFQQSQKPSRN